MRSLRNRGKLNATDKCSYKRKEGQKAHREHSVKTHAIKGRAYHAAAPSPELLRITAKPQRQEEPRKHL